MALQKYREWLIKESHSWDVVEYTNDMKVSADQYKPMQLEFESKAFFRKSFILTFIVIAAYITVALLLLGIIDFIWIDLPWTLIGTVAGYFLA